LLFPIKVENERVYFHQRKGEWEEETGFHADLNHRLGRGFPEGRRSALWAVQQRIEKKRLRLGMKYLLRGLIARFFARDARSLAGYAAEEYAKVLSPGELKLFLDLKKGEPAALPIDVERFHK
jgi:hypothetical protein